MNYIKLISFLLLVFLNKFAGATHNRAGEITFEHIQGYEYEITITTYTYTLSQADRDELTVLWGDDDNYYTVAPRIDSLIVYLPNFYKKNVYKARHTYPGPSKYTILVQDPNRNYGVKNIPNSVNVIFAITTTLIINANFPGNTTPTLLNPPTDRAALGHVFIHNPGAYDTDGDSLSYSLTTNRGEGGQPIDGYTLPPSSNTPIYIDPVSGNLVWDSPTDTGAYNIAINITEWRSGIKIGNIIRDMQIDVYNADNNPPSIKNQRNLCIIAGDTVFERVYAVDEDGDSVFMSAQGGPFDFNDSPALYSHDTTNIITRLPVDSNDTGITYEFDESTLYIVWPTTCSHIREQPYNIILRAEDDSDELPLSDIQNIFVRVIAPPPENLISEAYDKNIHLAWDKGKCSGAAYYKIYRFEGPSSFSPDSCETGIPESAEFTFIGQTEADTAFTFVDNNYGEGLIPGIEYCYRVVAVYHDGAESIASEETCATLEPGSPPITNVSLFSNNFLETDSVFVSWIQPIIPDTITPPFKYRILRSEDLQNDGLQLLENLPNANPDDTIYIDYSATDTSIIPYTYSVELYGQYNGEEVLFGDPELAATLYLNAKPGDNKVTLSFNKFSPWIDTAHVIYRKNNVSGEFDSIGITYKKTFTDSDLKNHKTYSYKAKSLGWRKIGRTRYNNENFSHPIKATPVDNEPPCAPDLSVFSNCDSLINTLKWNNPNLFCANDVVSYHIYYAFDNSNNLILIDSILNEELTTYVHQPKNGPVGFYAVTAIDSFYNESSLSNIVAVDTCKGYDLPMAFTPNNDGENDEFVSYNPNNYVKEIEIQIFNRWGQLMFETRDPAVKWDGRNIATKQTVSDGVYFYICTVYEPGVFNSQIVFRPRQLSGFIHVFTQPAKDVKYEDF